MVFLPTVVLFEIHRSGIDFSDIPLRPPSPIKQPMNIDERQRLWFFSRGERIAVIVLLTRPQKTREKSKTYTPRQQKLQPIEQEGTTE